MYLPKSLLVLFGLMVITMISNGTKLKPECPKYKHRLPLRLHASNRNRGHCQVTGPQQDTCRHSFLTCCPNIKGIMMCIDVNRVEAKRIRKFFRRFRQRQNRKPTTPSTASSDKCPEAVKICTDGETDEKCHTTCPYTNLDRRCRLDTECADGESCCHNPCDADDEKFYCISRVKLSPPTPKPIQLNDENSEGERVCPRIPKVNPNEGLSCTGWSPVPGVEGTGICDKKTKCATGRMCCQIDPDDCGKIQYCVKVPIKPKGCPIPEYLAVSVGKSKTCVHNSDCKKQDRCCPADTQGTMVCVTPDGKST